MMLHIIKKKEEMEISRLFSDVATTFDVGESVVREAMNSLRSELRDRPWQKNINYSGMEFDQIAKCCGYLKQYAACHCALTRFCTMELFSWLQYSTMLLQKDVLQVVSVGGGPGNDLIGFCSAIARDERRRFHRLDLTLIDCKSGWEEVFSKVLSLVSEENYGDVSTLFNTIDVRAEFVAADLCATQAPRAIFSADIILMTKVLSVVPDWRKIAILQRIFSCMKRGAIFLYIDIDISVVKANKPRNVVVLYESERRSFFYHVPNSSSITRSSYEICAMQKALYSEDDLCVFV